MAIKTKLLLANDNGLEQEYPNAYLRIQKVVSAHADYEYFEKIDDPEQPDIAERLKWTDRYENSATVYVWADQIARENRAPTIHWFNIEFEWDPNKGGIFEQAYEKLKSIFEISEDI